MRLFCALFIDTVGKGFDVSIMSNTGAAPDAGQWSGYPDGSTKILAPGTPHKKIPFLCMQISYVYGLSTPGVSFPQDRWFDLVATSGTSGFDPAGGSVKNVTAVIFEVPL